MCESTCSWAFSRHKSPAAQLLGRQCDRFPRDSMDMFCLVAERGSLDLSRAVWLRFASTHISMRWCHRTKSVTYDSRFCVVFYAGAEGKVSIVSFWYDSERAMSQQDPMGAATPRGIQRVVLECLGPTTHVCPAPQIRSKLPLRVSCAQQAESLGSQALRRLGRGPRRHVTVHQGAIQDVANVPQKTRTSNRYGFAFGPTYSALVRPLRPWLRIFPTVFFGNLSIHRTPLQNCLQMTRLPQTTPFTLVSLTIPAYRKNIYALGSSLPPSIGVPTTAASRI
jgi:hypothetical protein